MTRSEGPIALAQVKIGVTNLGQDLFCGLIRRSLASWKSNSEGTLILIVTVYEKEAVEE